MQRIESLLIDWIPRYWAAGKSYVTVAFGCTGGRHRSVAAAVEMAERLRARLPGLQSLYVSEVGAVVFVPLHDHAARHGCRLERNHGIKLPLADHHSAGALPEVTGDAAV